MKAKMKVKSKDSYLLQERKDMSVKGDKATRNAHLQKNAMMKGKKDFDRTKAQDSLVVSWLSPNKYKGFKLKTK